MDKEKIGELLKSVVECKCDLCEYIKMLNIPMLDSMMEQVTEKDK